MYRQFLSGDRFSWDHSPAVGKDTTGIKSPVDSDTLAVQRAPDPDAPRLGGIFLESGWMLYSTQKSIPIAPEFNPDSTFYVVEFGYDYNFEEGRRGLRKSLGGGGLGLGVTKAIETDSMVVSFGGAKYPGPPGQLSTFLDVTGSDIRITVIRPSNGKRTIYAIFFVTPPKIDSLEFYSIPGSFRQIDFVTDSIAFGLDEGYGISQTRDRGNTWVRRLDDNSPPTYRWMDFADDTTGYILEEKDLKMYRTSDAGATWKACDSSLGGLLFAFPTARVGYQIGSAIFKTTDGCSTWKEIVVPNSGLGALAMKFSDSSHGFIALKDGELMETEDGGDSWKVACKLPPNDLTKKWGQSAMLFLNQDWGYALTWVESGAIAVVKTLDGGKTWKPVSRAPYEQYEYGNSTYSIQPALSGPPVIVGRHGINWNLLPLPVQ